MAAVLQKIGHPCIFQQGNVKPYSAHEEKGATGTYPDLSPTETSQDTVKHHTVKHHNKCFNVPPVSLMSEYLSYVVRWKSKITQWGIFLPVQTSFFHLTFSIFSQLFLI